MYASANAHHTGSPCVHDPVYSIVDVVIASGTALGLFASDVGGKTPAWFLVPGVFAVSATVGLIGVAQCRAEERANTPKQHPDDFEYLQQPTSGVAAPVDAGVAPADADEPEHELPTAQPGPVLQLSPDYKLGAGVDAGVGDAAPQTDCSIYGCPAHQACVLDERNRTHCVPN
jgi:hypothetical protein